MLGLKRGIPSIWILTKMITAAWPKVACMQFNHLIFSNLISQMELLSPGKGKQKRASKLSVMEMLENKAKRKASLKEWEFDIRDMELNLQRVKFEAEQQERVRKEEEQRRHQELEFEERTLTLELLRKLE